MAEISLTLMKKTNNTAARARFRKLLMTGPETSSRCHLVPVVEDGITDLEYHNLFVHCTKRKEENKKKETSIVRVVYQLFSNRIRALSINQRTTKKTYWYLRSFCICCRIFPKKDWIIAINWLFDKNTLYLRSCYTALAATTTTEVVLWAVVPKTVKEMIIFSVLLILWWLMMMMMIG